MGGDYKTFDDLYRDRFSEMSITAEGLRYLYVRTLIDRVPLLGSKALRDFVSFKETRLSAAQIQETRERIYGDESIEPSTLEDLLRTVHKELEAKSSIDYDRLMLSLSMVSRDGDAYWEAWNGVFRDDIRQHIQHHFVRATSIPDYDTLIARIDKDLSPVVKGYTIISWYNQWTSTVIERLIWLQSSVVPTVRRIDKVDFFFQHIPFDLKVTFIPSEYIRTLIRNKAAKSAQEVFELLRSDPLHLARWLYENQGEMRFSDSHRIFVTLFDQNNPDASWKLKADFERIGGAIKQYFGQSATVPKIKWSFNGDRISGTFETYTDVLLIAK